MPTRKESIFAAWKAQVWKYRYAVTLQLESLHGGIPADHKLAEDHYRRQLDLDAQDVRLRQALIDLAAQHPELSQGELEKKLVETKTLCIFLRQHGDICVNGNNLKAALKEAANIGRQATPRVLPDKWGSVEKDANGKGGRAGKALNNYIAEHVFVEEALLFPTRDGERIPETDDVVQRLVHTWNGHSIAYNEALFDVEVSAVVATDTLFPDDFWAKLWTIGEMQGFGANRSQGVGTYRVVQWDRLGDSATNGHAPAKRLSKKAVATR